MSESIEEMLQRWEEEPTPQLSLQLAEEYRRHGQLEEGVTILEQALRLHPNHVAARVAHGRFLLESGRMEDAGLVLESVVDEDPTHLVANKLLIGLYLETDRRKEARDRLDLYKLLNESDPEIEVLEAELASGGAPRTAVDASGRVFVLAGSPPPPDLQEMVGERARRAALALRSRALASEGPFGDLWQGVDEDGYALALGAEGIFPVVSPPAAEEAEAEVVAPEELVEPPEPELQLVPEPKLEVEEPEEQAAGEAVVELAEASAEELPGPAVGATATLAKLYLDQGHLEDAAQAFEEVLEREPDHVEAREGLAETQRRLGESLDAEGLEEEDAEDESGDARSRKARVLRDYLDRLRAASGRL